MIQVSLTNDFIYKIVDEIEEAFHKDTRYFPARINFYIQKNVNALKKLKEEIHETREKMILHYGTYDAETGYCSIPPENVKSLNDEIKELMEITQDVSLHLLPLEWLDVLDLSFPQMEALMFMIDDSEEEFKSEGVEEEVYE